MSSVKYSKKAALVYGLTSATPAGAGDSAHWGDAKVVVSLVAAAVLLAAFTVIEARSGNPLLPVRVLRSRDRSGAYLIALFVTTALFGMFFFLTLFLQDVWGYSALKTGVAYLPVMVTVMAMSGVAAQLVPRIGARPLLIAGSVIAAGGLFWLSRLNEYSSYAGGVLGPMMVTAAGIGLMFVPMTLVSLTKVADGDTGVASSLLNTGQQVGGAIGLAILGTVAWSAVSSSLRSAAGKSGHVTTAMTDHALAYGFSRGFVVSAGITLLTLVVALVMLRVRRDDLAGINPMAAPAG